MIFKSIWQFLKETCEWVMQWVKVRLWFKRVKKNLNQIQDYYPKEYESIVNILNKENPEVYNYLRMVSNELNKTRFPII